MRRLKLSTVLIILAFVSTAQADRPPTPPAPEVSELDKAYLLRTVRRAVEAWANGREEYRPAYVPESLRSRFCRVAVTLRKGGRLRGIGSSPRRQLVDACLEAARVATRDPRFGPDKKAELVDACTIGIELIGEIQDLDIDLDDNARLRDAVDPGIDGLGIRIGERELCLTPGDMIAYGLLSMPGGVTARRYKVYPPAVWLRKRGPELIGEGSGPHDLRPFRFRTTHFVESDPNQPPVSLCRGVVRVPPETVTANALDEAIDRMGRYLHYRQISTGLFSYEYLPATDEYGEKDNVIRQAGAVWALVRYARWCGRSDVLEAATNGIRLLGRLTMSLRGNSQLIFLGNLGALNPLELSALYTLALIDHPDDKQFANLRFKFVAGIIMLQVKSGKIRDVYPPGDPNLDPTAQATAPGQGLLALARWYEQTGAKNKLIPKVFEKAFEYYAERFREEPTAAFVPWQSQAFAQMARLTHNDDYAAFVYELTDWLAEKQLRGPDGVEPEQRGGLAIGVLGQPGVGTAVCLEGFTDALALARDRGDRRRAERYEALVRGAARFVLQLMVRPEECYYILSPKDAVGGVRTTLTDHRLRIDNCQHAVMALMKTREVLFGKRTADDTMNK